MKDLLVSACSIQKGPIEFRPAVAGTMGKFKIDNVRLTNQREAKE